jgi:hypothetical protein
MHNTAHVADNEISRKVVEAEELITARLAQTVLVG